jgi:hypothetical protein
VAPLTVSAVWIYSRLRSLPLASVHQVLVMGTLSTLVQPWACLSLIARPMDIRRLHLFPPFQYLPPLASISYSSQRGLADVDFECPFVGNSLTVDLIYSPSYSSLRYCAQQGLDKGIDEYGCGTNDCLCREDILSSAITAISTEVDGYCTSASADASSAIAAVVGYCSANTYSAVSFSNPPSPTGPTTTSARPGEYIHHFYILTYV